MMGRVVKVPPGLTISKILDEKMNITVKEFARRMGLPLQDAEELIAGDKKITHEIALKLEAVLGFTALYWETREKLYREYLRTINEEEN